MTQQQLRSYSIYDYSAISIRFHHFMAEHFYVIITCIHTRVSNVRFNESGSLHEWFYTFILRC